MKNTPKQWLKYLKAVPKFNAYGNCLFIIHNVGKSILLGGSFTSKEFFCNHLSQPQEEGISKAFP